jgi:hypothetical protein
MIGLFMILVVVGSWVALYLAWWFFAPSYSLSGARGPQPEDRLWPWSKPRWLSHTPRGVSADNIAKAL